MRTDLDRAIDEIAAELTAGQPGASFRDDVMTRLDQRREVRWWWIMSPVAAVAMLVCALLFGPEAMRHSKSPAEMGRPAPLISRAIAVAGTIAVGHDPIAVSAQPSHQSARPPAVDSAVAALAPARMNIPLLTVEALEPAESIRVSSLETIAPITLAPIGAPQGEPR